MYRSSRPGRVRRLRRWLRVGVLLTIIGLIRVGRGARSFWPRILLVAGGVLTVAGISLPDSKIVILGIVALLAGVLSPSTRDTATDSARQADATLVYRR